MKIEIERKRIGIRFLGNKYGLELCLIPPDKSKWYNYFIPYIERRKKDGS